jgi:homoaconitate hydratase
MMTGGNELKSAYTVASKRTKIHKAWLVSCVNARAKDIKAAAKELQGKKVAPGVEFYVAAASSEVQASSELSGDWQVLLDAGAIVLPPGCGACAGLGAGQIQAGEVGIAATNRNFKGRMGSRDGIVHLSSPSVVAASAAEGYIVPPIGWIAASESPRVLELPAVEVDRTPVPAALVDLVDGFPAQISGNLLWCGADNISTDGIYHGKHMYEDMSAGEMASVAMENYDPKFGDFVRKLDRPILVSGSNFGTGSSREQAAQCLKHLGVTSVVAASYSATYTRNGINNGLPLFESLELVDFLRRKFGRGTETAIDVPTVNTGYFLQLDLASWQVKVSNEAGAQVGVFPLVPIGTAAQELIACDGLEPWIKKQISTTAHV